MYPAISLISDRPAAIAENTNSRRVSGVTAIDNPVRRPLLTFPAETTPVSAGASVTVVPAIGEKILLGVVELYSCAVMVTVDPTSARGVVMLKYAAIDVIIPSRGTEKAKLVFMPSPPVRSMIAPNTVVSVALAPNPKYDGKPGKPGATSVVNKAGDPDAKGIIAPAPIGPVDPVGPVSPVGPVGPVGPVSPVGPVGPVGPVSPVDPVGPV